MQQEYINQMQRELEYRTGEREFPQRKKEVEPWADTLEEADLI